LGGKKYRECRTSLPQSDRAGDQGGQGAQGRRLKGLKRVGRDDKKKGKGRSRPLCQGTETRECCKTATRGLKAKRGFQEKAQIITRTEGKGQGEKGRVTDNKGQECRTDRSRCNVTRANGKKKHTGRTSRSNQKLFLEISRCFEVRKNEWSRIKGG